MMKNNNKIGQKSAVVILSVLLLSAYFSGFSHSCAEELSANISTAVSAEYENTYSKYRETYQNEKKGIERITLTAPTVDVKGGETVSFEAEVPDDCLYTLHLVYRSLMEAGSADYLVSIMIDDKVPFFEAENVKFFKLFQNAREVTADEFGNELSPQQKEADLQQSVYFRSYDGYLNDPYLFFFSKGKHKITLKMRNSGMSIQKLELINESEPPSYEKALQDWQAEGISEQSAGVTTVQGEDAAYKSSTTLYPVYDNSSAGTTPSNASKIVLNTIGGSSWSYPGQAITWNIPKVPQSGLYRLAFRVRQNTKRGAEVSRKILINGQLQYKELSNYSFSFSSKWYIEELGNGKESYLVYLKKGTNTISLEAVASFPQIAAQLNQRVLRLNEFYRNVIMLVGTSPDDYQDYDLQHKFPDYNKTIQSLISELMPMKTELEEKGFKKGGETEVIDRIVNQLKSFIENPQTTPFRMSVFQTNVTSLASFIQNLMTQPLELDSFTVLGRDSSLPAADTGFFSNAAFKFRRFLSSFTNDYSTLSAAKGENVLSVWVNSGRDQAQIIKSLTENFFTAETGVKVSINLVQQSLVPATLAGIGPDVATFVLPNDIVNLAARDALTDVSSFGDYQSVAANFQKQSAITYTYLDKVYGLPTSETFYILFYRKDIFSKLSLALPKTWEGFYNTVKILQRSNLQVGIPNNEVMFQILLYQNGGSYYRDGWKTTGFGTSEAQKSFSQWTDFYTKYSLPVEYDFYSRFRTGEMPMGIFDYTLYNQLSVAAPEIKGLWGISLIPGTVSGDKINNSAVGGSTGTIIFKKATAQNDAWQFLKWWTSTEVQSEYAKEIEAVLGAAGRYSTANVEAFKTIGWDTGDRGILLSQWDHMVMIDQTPVNYYISRNITNAFRRVVYSKREPRETLSFYNRDINKEIMRRRQEFGLD